jgi:hypothetical protein
VPNGDDHDEEDTVINGVDDSIVAHPEPISGTPSQRTGRGRTRIVSEQRNSALYAGLDYTIILSKLTQSRRPELDLIVAHDQPRSIFTCSQGMLLPSSAIALSNATTS